MSDLAAEVDVDGAFIRRELRVDIVAIRLDAILAIARRTCLAGGAFLIADLDGTSCIHSVVDSVGSGARNAHVFSIHIVATTAERRLLLRRLSDDKQKQAAECQEPKESKSAAKGRHGRTRNGRAILVRSWRSFVRSIPS